MLNISPLHQYKRYAICKADFLSREFSEPINGSEFIVMVWSPYLQNPRSINNFQSLGREQMPRPPAQQCRCLIQNKVTGNKTFIPSFEFLPKGRGKIMVLILGQVAGKKSTGVNIYHISPVTLVQIRIMVEADIHGHLTLIHLLIGK